MAILEPFEATISINGQRAAEYDDDDSETKPSPNPKVVTKYVEAVAGTNFDIEISVKDDYTYDCEYIVFHVNLDGTAVSGRVMSPDHPRRSRIEGIKVEENGQTTLRKFKFGDLAISEFFTEGFFPCLTEAEPMMEVFYLSPKTKSDTSEPSGLRSGDTNLMKFDRKVSLSPNSIPERTLCQRRHLKAAQSPSLQGKFWPLARRSLPVKFA